MSAPQTGNREFRDEIVRIAELTVTTSVLESYTFQHCRIVGPAVLFAQGETSILHCSWNAPGIDAIFWEVPPTRTLIVGAVAISNCTFSSCTFEGVGIAGPRELREQMEAAFS